MTKKGTFTSVWDDGVEVRTSAELNLETGELINVETSDTDGLDILQKEYFTDEDGDEYEICDTCHEYITKSVMKDGIGKCYDEITVCSNPECESNW
jgi:hypothetical protein